MIRSFLSFFLFAWLCAGQTLAPVLPGAPNFHDIGGIVTKDGLRLKSGLLFRSGQLSALTEADFAVLRELRIQTVFDLRTEGERAAAPTIWSGSLTPVMIHQPMAFGAMPGNLPMGEMIRQLLAKVKTEDDARAMMMQGMADLAISGRAELGTVLAKLAEGGEPAIIHCTAGKDRTGLLTALLLNTLGVSREEIMKDYLRSNDAMKSAGALPPGMNLPFDPRILGPLMRVEPAYLNAALDKIRLEYGSFARYRLEGLKLSDAQVEKLRAVFLEK